MCSGVPEFWNELTWERREGVAMVVCRFLASTWTSVCALLSYLLDDSGNPLPLVLLLLGWLGLVGGLVINPNNNPINNPNKTLTTLFMFFVE